MNSCPEQSGVALADSFWPAAWLIFVGTLVVRLAIVWSLPYRPATPDVREYNYLAQRLLSTGDYGFADDWKNDKVLCRARWRYLYDDTGSVRPPGFPVWLLALHAGGVDSPAARQFAMTLTCGFAAIMVYAIGVRTFGRTAALIAALLYAVAPGDIQSMSYALREPMLTLFAAGGLLCLLRAWQDAEMRWAIVAGICFGVAGNIKETIALFGVSLCVCLFSYGLLRRQVRLALACAAVVCVTIVLMLPWEVRNTVRCHRFVGMSCITGEAEWQGLERDWLHVDSLKDFRLADYLPKEEAERLDPYRATSAGDADMMLREAAKIYVSRNPATVATGWLRNMGLFWMPFSRTVLAMGLLYRPLEIVGSLFYIGVFIGACVGAVVQRRRPEAWLMLFSLAAMTAVHGLFCGFPRYRVPFDFITFLFAACAVDAGLTWWRSRKAGATPSP